MKVELQPCSKCRKMFEQDEFAYIAYEDDFQFSIDMEQYLEKNFAYLCFKCFREVTAKNIQE